MKRVTPALVFVLIALGLAVWFLVHSITQLSPEKFPAYPPAPGAATTLTTTTAPVASTAPHVYQYPPGLARIPIEDVTVLKGHTDGVLALAFSPDNKILASGSADQTIILWDTAKAEKIAALEGSSSAILSLAFSPDGNWLLAGARDCSLVIWNVKTHAIDSTCIQRCPVYHLAFLPDNRHFVSACGHVLRVGERGQTKPTAVCTADDEVDALCVTSTGEVITGDRSGTLIVWDPLAGKELLRHSRPERDNNHNANSRNCVCELSQRKDGDVLVGDYACIWDWNRAKDTFSPISDIGAGHFAGLAFNEQSIFTWIGSSIGLGDLKPDGQSYIFNLFIRPIVFDHLGAAVVSPDQSLLAMGFAGAQDDQFNEKPHGPRNIHLCPVATVRKLVDTQKVVANKSVPFPPDTPQWK